MWNYAKGMLGGYDGNWRAVPNQRQIQLILYKFHDDPCAGHYAAEITYKKIYEAGYAWPTMIRDTREYCQSCERCQKGADLVDFPVEPLRPIIMLEPFE